MNHQIVTRRHLLTGSLATMGLWNWGGFSPSACLAGTPAAPPDPLAPKPPHHPPRAKHVIVLFMTGGVSHVDSFDPKPQLQADNGKPFDKTKLMASPWKAEPRGKCGTVVTDLFPHIGRQADDLCLIRSMHGDHNNHHEATLGMHTGSVTVSRPSLGAWISYALGTFNPNLPSHVVVAGELPYTGTLAWSADFLPAVHEGVRIVPGDEPIAYLRRQQDAEAQELELSLLGQFNALHLAQRQDQNLAARMQAFVKAHGLQRAAPEVFNLSKESQATLELYGVDRGNNQGFGWQCLIARRLIERGVRFVELIDIGSYDNWDSHLDIMTHAPLAAKIDRPIAALLADLKARGMMEETLVVWCTEFGRTPYTELGTKGRNHHSKAFTCWLAGAGVKAGYVHGATDRYGATIAANPVHVRDFHATILHLLGVQHQRLAFVQNGQRLRLGDVEGRVVNEILS